MISSTTNRTSIILNITVLSNRDLSRLHNFTNWEFIRIPSRFAYPSPTDPTYSLSYSLFLFNNHDRKKSTVTLASQASFEHEWSRPAGRYIIIMNQASSCQLRRETISSCRWSSTIQWMDTATGATKNGRGLSLLSRFVGDRFRLPAHFPGGGTRQNRKRRDLRKRKGGKSEISRHWSRVATQIYIRHRADVTPRVSCILVASTLHSRALHRVFHVCTLSEISILWRMMTLDSFVKPSLIPSLCREGHSRLR